MESKKDIIIKALKPDHRQILDEYCVNGFNKVKAVLAIKPHITYGGAAVVANTLFKVKANKDYIKLKQDEATDNNGVQVNHMLNELLTLAFSDVTDYIGLSLEELKALPPEVRRCLSSYESKTVTYLPRGAVRGEEVTETTIKFKLKDSMKAIEMINKHLGFYDADNRQKATTINLDNIHVDQLNVLLQVATQALKPNDG